MNLKCENILVTAGARRVGWDSCLGGRFKFGVGVDTESVSVLLTAGK